MGDYCPHPGCWEECTHREYTANGTFTVCADHLDESNDHHRIRRHGVDVSGRDSKADTQAVLIRGYGYGPKEAHEMSEKFGPDALEAAEIKAEK